MTRLASIIFVLGLLPWVAFAQPSRVLTIAVPPGDVPDFVCVVYCGATAHDATPRFCKAITGRGVVQLTVPSGQCFQAVTRTNGVLSFPSRRSDPEPEEPDEDEGRGPAPEFEK